MDFEARRGPEPAVAVRANVFPFCFDFVVVSDMDVARVDVQAVGGDVSFLAVFAFVAFFLK